VANHTPGSQPGSVNRSRISLETLVTVDPPFTYGSSDLSTSLNSASLQLTECFVDRSHRQRKMAMDRRLPTLEYVRLYPQRCRI